MQKYILDDTKYTALVVTALLVVFTISILIFIDFKGKGKRNTYCDQLRHLSIDHGYDIDLTECKKKEETDLQIKLKSI